MCFILKLLLNKLTQHYIAKKSFIDTNITYFYSVFS